MVHADKLLCCLNSIHYLAGKEYDIIVIDEIETVLNKWFDNSTLDQSKQTCWDTFLEMIRNARKCVFLDAFTTKITTDFIKSLGDNESVKIYEGYTENSNRRVLALKNLQI